MRFTRISKKGLQGKKTQKREKKRVFELKKKGTGQRDTLLARTLGVAHPEEQWSHLVSTHKSDVYILVLECLRFQCCCVSKTIHPFFWDRLFFHRIGWNFFLAGHHHCDGRREQEATTGMMIASLFLLSWSLKVFLCYVTLAVVALAFLCCVDDSCDIVLRVFWVLGIFIICFTFPIQYTETTKNTVCVFHPHAGTLMMFHHSPFAAFFSVWNCRRSMCRPQHAATTKFLSICASTV